VTTRETDSPRLAAAAALLAQGRSIDGLSRILTAGALLGAPVLATVLAPAALIPVLLVAAIGLGQSWFALRVGFDAALFEAVSRNPSLSSSTLDEALLGLGLLPPDKAGRPWDPRIAGARRLLAWQGALLALQVAVIVAVALVLVWIGR
jgi:hypothetical protein